MNQSLLMFGHVPDTQYRDASVRIRARCTAARSDRPEETHGVVVTVPCNALVPGIEPAPLIAAARGFLCSGRSKDKGLKTLDRQA